MGKENITTFIHARQAGMLNPLTIQKLLFSQSVEKLKYSPLTFQNLHNHPINCLDIDCTGRFLLSGGQGKSLHVNDLYHGDPESYPYGGNLSFKMKTERSLNGFETVQWYPHDSGLVFTSGEDKMLRTWDVEQKKEVEKFHLPGKIYQHHAGPVPSTQHCLIAVASSAPKVSLVDIVSGKQTHELDGHEHGVLCCQWSPVDEHMLVTGGLDSAILLWDVRSANSCLCSLDRVHTPTSSRRRQKAVVHKPYVNAVKFSGDGTMLISTGSDNELLAWNMSTLQNMKIPFEESVVNRRKRSSSLQTAGVGNFDVLIAPSDNVIKVFHLQSGKLLKTVMGHFSSVTSCVYLKQRMEVISAGLDRQIYLWTPYDKIRQTDEADSRGGRQLDNWN